MLRHISLSQLNLRYTQMLGSKHQDILPFAVLWPSAVPFVRQEWRPILPPRAAFGRTRRIRRRDFDQPLDVGRFFFV